MASPITLPTRRDTGFRGRRTGPLPQASDVTYVAPRSDPGVNVPDFGRFAGTGAEVAGLIGAGLDVKKEIDKAAARQQKAHDAVKTGQAEVEAGKQGVDEIYRLGTEGDIGNPDTVAEHEKWWTALIARTRINLNEDKVSAGAIERSILRLEKSKQASMRSLGVQSLTAQEERLEQSRETDRNLYSAQAAEFPGAAVAAARAFVDRAEESRESGNKEKYEKHLTEGLRDIYTAGISAFTENIVKGEPGAERGALELLDKAAPFLSGAQQNTLRDGIESAKKMFVKEFNLAQNRARQEAKRVLEAAQEATKVEFLSRVHRLAIGGGGGRRGPTGTSPNDPLPPLTIAQIAASNLSLTDKRTFITLIEDQAAGVVKKRDDGIYNGHFTKVVTGELKLDAVFDAMKEDLKTGAVDGEDIDRLRTLAKQVAADDEKEPLARFFAMAKSQITTSSLLGPAPIGDRKFYEFTIAFMKKFRKAKEEGKITTSELLDPTSSHYLAKGMLTVGTKANPGGYIPSPADKLSDMAIRMGLNAANR